MNRHAQKAQKRMNMTNTEASCEKVAIVAAQGAHVAPTKGPSKKGASKKKGAPKGQKAAKGGKAKAAAPTKKAKAAKKAAAKILEMIGRAKGATLAEIMKAA